MSERIYRARLDALTAQRVEQWKERRNQSPSNLWWHRWGKLVGWGVLAVSGLCTGAIITWLIK